MASATGSGSRLLGPQNQILSLSSSSVSLSYLSLFTRLSAPHSEGIPSEVPDACALQLYSSHGVLRRSSVSTEVAAGAASVGLSIPSPLALPLSPIQIERHMAGAAFPRPFSSVGEFEQQVKARQAAASSCSTSSRSTSYARALGLRKQAAVKSLREGGCGADRCGSAFLGQQGDLLNDLLTLSLRPSSSSSSSSSSILSATCLMQGVWEEADSEGKGNSQFISRKSTLKKEPSLLLNLVREIQPLDVNQISNEASPDSTDAMKRTISGMLGLLPSDQFNVTVETSREPLAKLFVSSMMTGYTLRNAEYRLCLQRSLDVSEDDEGDLRQDRGIVGPVESHEEEDINLESVKAERDSDAATGKLFDLSAAEELAVEDLEHSDSLGPMSDEVKVYVQSLKRKLACISKELEECKRISTGLQMQNIVGEEKNDLLDYLRGLEPDKVAELSQPTSPEVEDVIQQVINDLLENPSTKLQYKGGNGPNASTINGSPWKDCPQKLSSSPLQFQSTVIVSRDYLARLLFWCMLMGHHMRGLEYRLELSRTLSLSGDLESGLT